MCALLFFTQAAQVCMGRVARKGFSGEGEVSSKESENRKGPQRWWNPQLMTPVFAGPGG